ncbi:MAG: cobalt ECF transporter T component CbiQ [Acidimicrobiales bacterium]|nr:cobalt ECF transporter T component CbiQ [Acidimicrobiales bacterium]
MTTVAQPAGDTAADAVVVPRGRELPGHVKVAAALAFVVGVVATPREAVAVFVVDAVAVVVLVALTRVRPSHVARRLLIETPFVAFAFALPFVARGPRIDVGPLTLSVDGLWGAWGILVKGTLGVAVAVVLATATPVPDLLAGARRLRVPVVLTAIAGFMVRYGAVLVGELERLRVARVSRGDDPRWLWQARGVAATAGTLFVRSFERGERVHLAMVARGFDGTWPAPDDRSARPAEWLAVSWFPAVALAGAALALVGAV